VVNPEWPPQDGRNVLVIGKLVVRHGYQDHSWSIIDYYWNSKLVMTSARWYVTLNIGEKIYGFFLKHGPLHMHFERFG
jgi:hypothetical protein